jgi:dipeptidyl aminopeptidase/acylaminoacyl peptidase
MDSLFFISDGRIGSIRPDGTEECYPKFDAPNQATWQMEYVFPDGRQAVLLSQEPPKNPNASFYDQDGMAGAKTHLWRHDFRTQSLYEIDLPPFLRIAGVIPENNRFLVSGNNNHIARILTSDLDGGNREEIWSGPGYAYGTSLSPDGRKAAHHVTGAPGRPGYEIYVIDLASKECTLIASDPDFLQFGPLWSPDGQWLLYQRCLYRQDPGHDRSDVCINRADGSEHRVLTTGQAHWFATSYGTPARHGSGSNMPVWSPAGLVTCALLLPGSRSAWPYAVDRPDTDHFNRDYRPEQAQGGTQICLIDPNTGIMTPLSQDDPPTWNFRLAWAPDGSQLAFIRADVGGLSELWVMDAQGGNRRRLTRGLNGTGVDHPRWVRGCLPGTQGYNGAT